MADIPLLSRMSAFFAKPATHPIAAHTYDIPVRRNGIFRKNVKTAARPISRKSLPVQPNGY